MMKRTIYAILAAMMLLFPGWLWAQGRIVERTYLSTDRDVYVAGDVLWYSAFCVDASQGTLSPVSGMAYVELHSPDAVVCSGKVALLGGRGAGRLSLPVTVPTGNYRLVAYTAQNKAEEGYDYSGMASKTISVFNVYSNERLTGGVEVVSDGEYESLRSPVRPGMTTGSDGSVMPGSDRASVSLRWDGDSLTVVNAGATPATLSISVFHDDGILSNDNPTIADFLAACRRQGPVRFDNTVIPEYEGEIIRGHVTGLSPEKLPSLVGRYAFISTPSDKSDVYTSVIDGQGRVEFFTGNIYGNKECICEIEGIDPSLNCFIELESPFVQARVAAVEPLRMAASLKDALSQRSFAMQVERRFTPDTLYELLRVRENGLFGTHEIVYPLDDYTRFPTMGEVFIEFIPEIRARRWPDGRRNIQVRLEDGTETIFSRDTTLMMLDGVPVFDASPELFASISTSMRAGSGIAASRSYLSMTLSPSPDISVLFLCTGITVGRCLFVVLFSGRGRLRIDREFLQHLFHGHIGREDIGSGQNSIIVSAQFRLDCEGIAAADQVQVLQDPADFHGGGGIFLCQRHHLAVGTADVVHPLLHKEAISYRIGLSGPGDNDKSTQDRQDIQNDPDDPLY